MPGLLKAALNLTANAPDSAYRPTSRPKWTGNAYAQYTPQPLWGEATFAARVHGNYISKMLTHPNANIHTLAPLYTENVPGYWLVNARAAI